MRYKFIYFAISALVLIPGLVALFLWGLNPAIDFTGGTLWELSLELESEVSVDELRNHLQEAGFTPEEIRKAGDAFLLKLPPLEKGEKDQIEIGLEEKFGSFEEVRYETVGPTLGRELLTKTILGIILAAALILGYIAWRFKSSSFGGGALMYGICAVLAMFHDTLIVLGIFSLLGHFYGVEVDTLFVTAVLTVLSFSVHDTVVVYDRIRELRKMYPKTRFAEVVNRAVGDTLVRSVNNSLTIIFMLLALLLLGGETIRWFVVALLVGTIAGTYSSTFTAAPLLVVWNERVNSS